MATTIQCGHCGGAHGTVAEVRSCAAADPTVQFDESAIRPDEATPSATPHDSGPTAPDAVALAPDWARLAGPTALGRSVVVVHGQPSPPPWESAPRIRVEPHPSTETFDRLQAAWTGRERVVIELTDAVAPPDPVLDIPFWELTPDLELDGERLRHLVFANSVDARDPDAPTVDAISRAVAAGAVPAVSGDGDVTADGQMLWCDGGPLDRLVAIPDAVVPAVHLAIGSLTPVGRAEPEADLAPDQLAAVRHDGGAARIIAPAGSGKTRVLVERARHLVRDMGVAPSAICLVAYNVRARDEMLERTADLRGLGLWTLNSLALAIQSGRAPFRSPATRRPRRVIDEREVRSLLDGLVGGRRRAMSDPMAAWIEALTSCRLGLISPARVERDFGGDVKGFAEVLPQYRAMLADRGLVDFDEQILGAIEVLLSDPAARAAARRACAVLLVDEFQDLTPAHVLLLRMLAGPVTEVFGVGDDDQTIYGYAGASPEWLIDFARLFPAGAVHDLQVNYRCSPEVIAAATTLLTHNRRRIDKTVVAAPGREPAETEQAGSPLRVTSSPEPTVNTVARVVELLGQGVDPCEIAVLARVNAVLLGPMLALDEMAIPTSAPINESFLGRTGVAGALAWLRLAVAPDGRLAGADLETAVRRPPRGLSPRLAGWVGERTNSRDLAALASRLNDERDRQKVAGFSADLDMVRALAADGATSEELLVAVRDDLGLGRVLDQRLDASRRSVDRSAHGDDLAALISVARLHPDASDFGPWLAARLGAAARDRSGVQLSTIHRVKGREWPHVIVHDASHGLFPHRLSTDVEEERRVFHVAITRASQTLLVAAGAPPSVFVGQLSEARDPSAGPEPEPEPSKRRASGPGPSARPSVEMNADEAELADTLRAWRKVRSASDEVPAYVVFDDRTLEALVLNRPSDERELLDIRGIGPAKVEKYGSSILALLAGEPVPSSSG